MGPVLPGRGPSGEVRRGAVPLPSGRGVARAAGLLLILATVTVMAADAVEPTFASMAGHPGQLALSLLLRIVAAGASAGIAISLYPVLRQADEALATGAVVFRTAEAVMYLIGVVAALSLLPLSEDATSATGEGAATIRTLADSVTTLRHNAGLVAVFMFAAGALLYYGVFYRARLVPRWLSAWGLLAVATMFVACLLALFQNRPVADYLLLAAPIFLQEIVLGVWLLTRGFTPAEQLPRGSAEAAISDHPARDRDQGT